MANQIYTAPVSSQVASNSPVDPAALEAFVNAQWAESVLPALSDYIRIPNKSPAFDPDWATNGLMDRAVELMVAWCRDNAPPGAEIEVLRAPERTPLICVEIPATGRSDDAPVMLYGHLDKQPEMTGWSDDLAPWSPVVRDDRLYGRGGADDGYACFAAITAIAALHRLGVPYPRCLVLIEAGEESGSPDLPYYVEQLDPRMGAPGLIVCLDSGCADYDRLWLTTSLRGIVVTTLEVELIKEGVHSGDATGIVPSSFRVARQLLDRLEDVATGQLEPGLFQAAIPPGRAAQIETVAGVLGKAVIDQFPWHPGARPIADDPATLIRNATWGAGLELVGADGLPPIADAGNVFRPRTALRLSLRLPPTLPADDAIAELTRLLEADPPYGARVKVTDCEGGDGWDAAAEAPWLTAALDRASQAFFGQPAVYMGEGGSIPFMAMLGQRYPAAQFVITGLLGPHSNAHGPNEFLDLPTARRLTCCTATLLADYAARA